MYDQPDWERTYTVEEFFYLHLPDEYKRIELVNGKLLHRPGGSMIMGMLGVDFSVRATNFLFEARKNLPKYQRPGTAFSLAGIVLNDDPKAATIRVPSASYLSKERAALVEARQRALMKQHGDWFVLGIPDWVLEFMRPNDNRAEIQARVEDFMRAGVRLLWLVEYDKKLVHIFRENNPEVQTLGVGDILDGSGVLPDVHIELAEIFNYNL